MRKKSKTAGMTLVELMVTLLLMLLFMGAASVVLSGVSNSVYTNIELDRAMSIAQTVLQQIQAETQAAGRIKCRGGAALTKGDRLEYTSEKEGFTIVLGVGDGSTIQVGRTTLTPTETQKGYLEKRYYTPSGDVYTDENDDEPIARGVSNPLAAEFYFDYTIQTEFELTGESTVGEDTCYNTLTATVTVLDDSDPVTTQTRTILLLNTPPLAPEKTATSDG